MISFRFDGENILFILFAIALFHFYVYARRLPSSTYLTEIDWSRVGARAPKACIHFSFTIDLVFFII